MFPALLHPFLATVSMACTLKQCAAALLLLAAAAQAVHLDFAAGLNGWQHSDDENYAGKFELATPEGLTSQALKVRGPRTSVITASGDQQAARSWADGPPTSGLLLLQVPEKAKHYGISTLLPEAVDPAQDLVLQFELKLTNGLSCGGAYIKFVTADDAFTPAGLKDDTPYSVMFGPDKCGSTNKVRRVQKTMAAARGTGLGGCRRRPPPAAAAAAVA